MTLALLNDLNIQTSFEGNVIKVYPKPTARFDFIPSNNCAFDTVEVINTSRFPGLTATYKWSVSPNNLVVIRNNTDFEPSFYFPDNQTNIDIIYTVQLIVTSANGISDSIRKQITIFSRPNATFNLPIGNCGPYTPNITNSTANVIYQNWSSNPNATLSTPNDIIPRITFPVNNTPSQISYKLTLLVRNAHTCIDTVIRRITIYPKPEASFTSIPDSGCTILSVNFNNTSNPFNNENINTMSFRWFFGNGLPSVTSINSNTLYNNLLQQDVIYKDTLIATTQHGCSDTAYANIKVFPKPKSFFSPLFTNACAPFTISQSLLGLVPYPMDNDSYRWEVLSGNGNVLLYNSNSQMFGNYIIPNENDSVLLRLITNNIHGCRADTMIKKFKTYKNPDANFHIIDSMNCHPFLINQFNNSSSTLYPPLISNWYYGDRTAPNINITNPSHTFNNYSHNSDSIYHVVLVVSDNNTCKDTIRQDVTVYALPIADFSTQNNCLRQITDYYDTSDSATAPLYNWSWNFNDPLSGTNNSSTSQNSSHLYGLAGTYNVHLTVKNEKECSHDTIKPVTIYPLPNVNFVISDSIPCVDSTNVRFSNRTTGAISYIWNFGDGSPLNFTTSPSHQYQDTGRYIVTLIAKTIYDCMDTLQKEIYVIDVPVSDFIIYPDSGCAPLAILSTNYSFGYYANYFWSFPGGNPNASLSFNSPVVIYQQGINDTLYKITLTALNKCGRSSHLDSVIVMPQPTARMGMNIDYCCSTDSIVFTNRPSSGLPDLLIWDFGDGSPQIQTTNMDTISHRFYTGLDDTLYFVNLIAINECGRDTAIDTVRVLPNIVNAFIEIDTNSGCVPFTVLFRSHSSPIGLLNFLWRFGDGTPNANTNIDYVYHTFDRPGIYTVILQASDLPCGYDTDTVYITVWPKPDIDFTFDSNPLCVYNPVHFIPISNPNDILSNFNWSFGDGSYDTLNTNPSHLYDTSGVFNTSLTVQSYPHQCTNSVRHNVTINFTPKIIITPFPDTSGCQPFDVHFTNRTINQDINHTNSYSWNFGDGNGSGLKEPTHIFQNLNQGVDNTYIVNVIASTDNNCYDTAKINVIVHPKPISSFATDDSVFCSFHSPEDVSFISNSDIVSADNALSSLWMVNGNIVSLFNSFDYTFTNMGAYNISLIVENNHGCKDTSEVEYILYPNPFDNVAVDPIEGCEPMLVSFSSPMDSIQYVWYFGDRDSSSSSGELITHLYLNRGTYPLTIYAYGLGGCMDTSNYVNIVVRPTPHVSFEYERIYDHIYNGVFYFINTSSDGSLFGDRYNWNMHDESIAFDTNFCNLIYRFWYNNNFHVVLTATNQFGCKDSAVRIISIDSLAGLFIPNSISPDDYNEGVNLFKPVGVGLSEYLIEIFNGWGNIIWSSNLLDDFGRPVEAWNGKTKNGNPVPQDVYVWKVTARFKNGQVWEGNKLDSDSKPVKSGIIKLIR